MNEMPIIGLGTAAIGRPQYINIRQESKQAFSLEDFQNKGKEVLEEAYRIGIRYFDTAPGYGLAEQLLVEWITEKQDVDLEIATKWGYTYTANFKPNPAVHELKEHSLAKLNEQWLVSKSLLPRLTTYQIHSATLQAGVLDNTDILNRLAELKHQHGLKIGITTTGANQAEVIHKAIEVEVDGVSLFDTYQCTYNILDQSLSDAFEILKRERKRIIIKEALANGRIFPNRNYPHYQRLYSMLEQLAQKYSVGVDAIALRFCINSVDPFVVLSGAATVQHVQENMQAGDIRLDSQEIGQLKHFSVPPATYWDERKKLSWT